MRPFAASVRVRLALQYAAAMTIFVVVFAVGTMSLLHFFLKRELTLHLEGQSRMVAQTAINNPGALPGLEERHWVMRFAVVRGDTTVFLSPEWTDSGLSRAPSLTPRLESIETSSGSFYVLVREYPVPGTGEPLRVAVAHNAHQLVQEMDKTETIMVLSIPVAILLSALIGYWLAGRLLAPIGQMAQKATEISAERLNDRLPVHNRNDEFGQLATAFNASLARLEEGFEQMRRFTSDVSHELRTPIAALRSVGEVGLRGARSAEELEEVIGSMLEEADRLGRMIENLLTLSRAEATALHAELAPLRLGDLAREVADLLRILAEERDQTLLLRVDDDAVVRGDARLLRHSVVNLVDNAIKFTPEGGRIEIRVALRDPETALLEVKDSGPGIPAEHGQRVFDRFYRVETSRSRERGGVGLGLAIAQRMVQLHGGRMELESREGQGACFRIVLPALAVPVEPVHA